MENLREPTKCQIVTAVEVGGRQRNFRRMSDWTIYTLSIYLPIYYFCVQRGLEPAISSQSGRWGWMDPPWTRDQVERMCFKEIGPRGMMVAFTPAFRCIYQCHMHWFLDGALDVLLQCHTVIMIQAEVWRYERLARGCQGCLHSGHRQPQPSNRTFVALNLAAWDLYWKF